MVGKLMLSFQFGYFYNFIDKIFEWGIFVYRSNVFIAYRNGFE